MSQIGDKLQENISKISLTNENEINNEQNKSNLFNNLNTNNSHSQNLDEANKELRPFKCRFSNCDKDYNNKSRLEIHLRTHVNKLKILQ